jgi:hypothetical protein
MVLFLFDNVIYVFLLLWLCILIVCLCVTTLPEVFPCFFLSCKVNARVKNPQRRGTACTLPNCCVVLCIICFVTYSVLFVCICVLNYCHRVATRLQLNISYHISYIVSYIIFDGIALSVDIVLLKNICRIDEFLVLKCHLCVRCMLQRFRLLSPRMKSLAGTKYRSIDSLQK